jgi:hypothetical protein
MKLHKLFSVCALLLASANFASATPLNLYITGSTAFRSNVEKALRTQVFDADGQLAIGFNGTTQDKQNCAVYHGNIGGVDWIIETAWSGSEAGIQTVAGAVSINFLNPSLLGAPGSTTNSLDDVTQTGYAGTQAVSQIPDTDLSDTAQAASQFNGLFRSVTYPALNEAATAPIGINVFKFIANKGSSLTGITSQQVRALYSAGKLSLAFFTGNNADEANSVYCTGRNPDSGTRVTELLETGYGTATSIVKHFQPQTSGGAFINGSTGGLVGKLVVWPNETINGIPANNGNSGYSSGGNLAKSLNNDFTNGGAGIVVGTTTFNNGGAHSLSFVGYASSNDADAQIGAGVVELAYNGVKVGVSADYNTNTLLTEGQYTFWSKEHMNYGSAEDATHIAVINSIAADVAGQALVVLPTSLKVTRATDGGVVKAGYAVF